MIRKIDGATLGAALVGIAFAMAAIGGCKSKTDTEEPIKIPEKKSADASATPAASSAPSATTSSAPGGSASASAAASASTSASPVTSASAVPESASSGAVASNGAGIDKCCSALAAVQSSGVGKEAKAKSATAALSCPGISKLVKSGRTSRGAALTQVKASLAGVSVPSACN